MSYPVGTFIRNGKIARCEVCGDSRKPYNGHKVIYPSGKWYCYRCGSSGRSNAFWDDPVGDSLVTEKDVSISDPSDEVIESGRFSCLTKYRHEWGEAFQMRNPQGDITGWYIRSGKKSYIKGKKSFGYTKLISTFSKPLVIVEGVYDCLFPNYVCTFGLINKSVRQLKGHHIILMPDGDVWLDKNLKNQFIKVAKELILDRWINVIGVNKILHGLDPDEATRDEIVFVRANQLERLL